MRQPWPNGSGLEPTQREPETFSCVCERKNFPCPLEPGEPPPAGAPQDSRSQEAVKTKPPKGVTWASPENVPQIIKLQSPELDHNGVLPGNP
eukprot:15449007-Alexandrium_andersonii.AAC.1